MRWTLVCLLASGCALIDGITGTGSTDVPEVQRTVAALLPAGPPTRDVDLLFVIDNSSSMSEEQTSLLAAFPVFMEVLQQFPGGLPNVHIGVVSSDVGVGPFDQEQCMGNGDNGLLQSRPRGACSAPTDRYISDVSDGAGGRIRNYSATLETTFSCIARLGASGCGFEQHLESMKRALDGSNPDNAGFLRPGSFLAIIIIGDEDDCSASDPAIFNSDPALDNVTSLLGTNSSYRCTEFGVTCDGALLPRQAGTYATCSSRTESPYLWHPNHYRDFLLGLRDPTQLFVAAISGDASPFSVSVDHASNSFELDPSCMSANGDADPGVRFRDFLAGFPNRNVSTSICNPDLSAPLTTFSQALATYLSGTCLSGSVAGAATGQVDCKVYDVLGTVRSEMPRCDGGAARPCFHLEADPIDCHFSPGNLGVTIDRSATPPVGTHVVVECAP